MRQNKRYLKRMETSCLINPKEFSEMRVPERIIEIKAELKQSRNPCNNRISYNQISLKSRNSIGQDEAGTPLGRFKILNQFVKDYKHKLSLATQGEYRNVTGLDYSNYMDLRASN